MSDKKIAVVYETKNYAKFKIIEGNRPIDHAKKIIESISEIGMLWQPILVNEKFEIIDGQGRFLAMKTLGIPVIYIIQNGLNIKHVRYLNKNATNWKINDYIHSYATGADSKESFVNLEVVKKQFPEFNQNTIMRAASAKGLSAQGSADLRNGTYDGMAIEQMNVAIRRLTKLREIAAFIPQNLRFRTSLLNAIIFCEYISEVDANFSIDQLTDAIKKNLGIVPLARNLRDAIENVDYMYNYKRLGKNRYDILRKYEDVKREINFSNLGDYLNRGKNA